MSVQQSEDGKQAKRRREEKVPKPTLMKSYAAVSDDDLQGIVGRIRSITRSAEARGAPPAVVAREVEPAPNPLDQSIDQSIDQPVDQSLDQSIGESTNWSIQRSNVRSIGRPNDSSIDRSIETPDEMDAGSSPHRTIALNLNQAILYQCIYWLGGQTTSLQRIGQVTGISAFTLKNCLRKLRRIGAIDYHGRQNEAGRMGFSATALPCVMVLRGDEHQLLQRLEEIKLERLPIARPVDPARTTIGDRNGLLNGPMTGPLEAALCSSSIKELLLQDLVLEDAFRNLNPHSLLPHLEYVDTAEELQDFLDMANACVAASRRTESPIRNPKGFLIAQLRAGYINPPEGYKSRRIRAQEKRNRTLQAELEEIKRLKAEEEELELNILRAGLSPSEQQQLAQEARHRVNPRSPLSEARQIEMAETEILRGRLQARRTEDPGAPPT